MNGYVYAHNSRSLCAIFRRRGAEMIRYLDRYNGIYEDFGSDG